MKDEELTPRQQFLLEKEEERRKYNLTHPLPLIDTDMVKLWVHVIWTTAHQQPVIFDRLRLKLYPYMNELCAVKGINIVCLNGHAEHVHCLFPLTFETEIINNIEFIQRESAHWINRHGFIEGKEQFSWNRNYIAVSVGLSSIDSLNDYIKRQEYIHKKKTFQQEFDDIVAKYEFKRW